MNLKEARALVNSREKLNPDYAKAVKMCIEGDKTEVKLKVEAKKGKVK